MHLYFHIPFCLSKCDYCDFYSVVGNEAQSEYFRALNQEIDSWINLQNPQKSPIKTIYFGGGTPSIAPVFQIEKILNNLRNNIGFAQTVEVTLEINPGETSCQKLAKLYQIGINRISIGCQSFLDADLSSLGRVHSSKQALSAVEIAKDAGFLSIGLDLIFGIPEQTVEDWKRNLEIAINLEIQHISVYNLTAEKGTKFYESMTSGDVKIPDETVQEKMFLLAQDMLIEARFEHYEISNYAKTGFHSHHNSNYWSENDYRGFGASAHSLENGRRFWNVRDLEKYVARLNRGKSPIEKYEILTTKEKFHEIVLTGLRTADGISSINLESSEFHEFTRRLFQNFDKLDYSLKEKFIVNQQHFRLKPKAWLMCDSLIEKLVAEI